jgi:hypothetical protein
MDHGERATKSCIIGWPVVDVMGEHARTLNALTESGRMRQYWLLSVCGIPMNNLDKYAKIKGAFE